MATTQIRILLTHYQKVGDSNPPSQRPRDDVDLERRSEANEAVRLPQL